MPTFLNMTKPFVIYHGSCNDGFCAAFLLAMVYGDAEVELFPANYQEPPPDVNGRNVFIVDFSYKRPVMKDLLLSASQVVVLDHHKTAVPELDGLLDELAQAQPQLKETCEIDLDLSRSGAMLTYDWLKRQVGIPVLDDADLREPLLELVRYVQDHDFFRFEMVFSREFRAWLQSFPLTVEAWRRIAQVLCDVHYTESVPWLLEGKGILRYQQALIASGVSHAVKSMIAGHAVPVVNSTTKLTSDIVGELAKGQPFAAGYFDAADGRRVYSLRSDAAGLDVSEIAIKFGGGGHARAAGFTIETLDGQL